MSIIENQSVGTLSRGLDILSLFATLAPELSQSEISDALGLPLPTVHRLAGVLTARGFLERDEKTRRLRLGLELARLMPPLLSGIQLPELARGQLLALSRSTHETVNLAVLQGSEIMYLISQEGDRLLTPQAAVGQRLPAHCTALGKCLLAQLHDEAARAALGPEPYEERTPHTCTTWKALRSELVAIRRTGVSRSDQEYEIGLISIAVPVSWAGELGFAAINVSLPASRLTDQFHTELVDRLLETARTIDSARAVQTHASPHVEDGD